MTIPRWVIRCCMTLTLLKAFLYLKGAIWNAEVKYYPQDWDEAKLMEFFSQCGPVTAAAVKIDEKGRKFAFVPWLSWLKHHLKVKEKEAEGDRRRACREKNCFGALGSMTTTSLRKPDFVFMLYNGGCFNSGVKQRMAVSRWTMRVATMPRDAWKNCMAWTLG